MLKNLRCFGPEQKNDFSDGNGSWARLKILLGENGTGKTTLLQACAAMAPFAASPVPGGSAETGTVIRLSYSSVPLFPRSVMTEKLALKASVSVNNKHRELRLDGFSKNRYISHRNSETFSSFLVGYGSKRVGKQQTSKFLPSLSVPP